MTHQICTVLNEATYHRIIQEAEKRNTSNSKALAQVVNEYYTHGGFNGTIMKDTEMQLNSLKSQLKDNESQIHDLKLQIDLNGKLVSQLQSENVYLRQEFTKATETLNRFMLPAPKEKRSIWDRLKRKKQE